jgi:pectate lyase
MDVNRRLLLTTATALATTLAMTSACSDRARSSGPDTRYDDAGDASVSEGSVESGTPGAGGDDSGMGSDGDADGAADADGDAGPAPVTPPAPPAYNGCAASQQVGWSTVNGLGFTGPATGGSGGPEVAVSNATDLEAYATDPNPRVILVSGVIDIPVLDVTSNKTIRGVGSSSGIKGGIRIAGTSSAQADMLSNIVIQNLWILASTSTTGGTTVVDNDGISIAYAHHVWIDHVSVLDSPGDEMAVTLGSDYVTISWSSFDFTLANARGTATLIGHADTDGPTDTGRLHVSLHHNWWGHAVSQRMPRVRFGQVHIFDNYYSARNDLCCVAAALDSSVLVQNNYFDGSLNPHVFFSFNGLTSTSSFSEPTAQMVVVDDQGDDASADGGVNENTYIGGSALDGGMQAGQGPAFAPPYPVTLEPADGTLVEKIQLCAGPQ